MTSPGYVAARESVAVFSDTPRKLILLEGSKAARVLEGLATNSVLNVPSGQGVYTFFLDRKGRVVADARVLPAPSRAAGEDATDERFWIDVSLAGFEPLVQHLKTFVPPIFATWSDQPVRVFALQGPDSLAALTAWAKDGVEFEGDPADLGPLGAIEWRTTEGDHGLLVRREDGEGPGFDVYAMETSARPQGVVEAVEAQGGQVGTPEDAELLRIEYGVPAMALELGPDRLAQEAGQDGRAISFEKGCFTGQEVVARVHYRGRVNRLLRGIRRTGAASIAAEDPASDRSADPGADEGGLDGGAELFSGDKVVAWVTSVGRSPRFGEIALAYVRREIEPGDPLSTGKNGPAEYEAIELPFT